MTTSHFDDPAFSSRLFSPRRGLLALPPGASDHTLAARDGTPLHFRLYPAPGPLVGVVLFPGNEELASDYDALAARFHAARASLAVISYRGYGPSGGTPTLRGCLEDAGPCLLAAGARLVHGGLPLPLVVFGRSLGSACAAELARAVPRRASGFVLESGFSDLRGLLGRRGVRLDGALSSDDIDDFDPLGKLSQSRAPLLLLHGEADAVVAPAEAEAARAASGAADSTLELLPGVGHNDLQRHPRYWSSFSDFVARVALGADRRAGSLVTQALGDALGFLVEGQHPAICARYAEQTFSQDAPPARTSGPFAFGQYSDDTQLARELALSLASSRAFAPEDFAARVARLFAEDTIVGRGRATENAARRLIAGVPWDQAGEPSPSAGNGAAMRAAPAGLRFADAGERARVSDAQARVTHRDPRARAAALLVADVAADAAACGAGPRGAAFYEALAARVRAQDPALAEGVLATPSTLTLSLEEAAARIARVGESGGAAAMPFERWHGISPFSTPSALYAFHVYCRFPGDAAAVLRAAVSVGGDVDTVAAMSGAMTGAAVGLVGLDPRLARWATRLNDNGAFGLPELVALGHALT